MSLTITQVVPRHLSAVYDGTNGADLVAAIPDAVPVSDDGERLEFSLPNGDRLDASVGQVVVWRQKGNTSAQVLVYERAGFDDLYAPL